MLMICCGPEAHGSGPSRRDLIRSSVILGAIVGGTALMTVADPDRAYATARAAGPGAVQPTDLELGTLTEISGIFTWYTSVPGTDEGLGGMRPAPADGEIVYGTNPAKLSKRVRSDDGP